MVKEKGSELANSDTVKSLKDKVGTSVNYYYEKFFSNSQSAPVVQIEEQKVENSEEKIHAKNETSLK